MFIQKTRLSDWLTDTGLNALVEAMPRNYRLATGIAASPNEITSWNKSLPAFARVISRLNTKLHGCTIYLEYYMPGNSARADVVMVGTSVEGYRAAVVVELKQWDARTVKPDGHNVALGTQIHPHPSDQALGYKEYLQELSVAFADKKCRIASCAFLHNALSNAMSDLCEGHFKQLVEISPLFGGDQEDELAKLIEHTLEREADASFISDMDDGSARVSKTLFENVSMAVRAEPAWQLLDEQKAIYNLVKDLVTTNDCERHLVLVTGGPGTGKSVIAMQLMGELCRRMIPTVHVTNSSSFTTVMRSKIEIKRDTHWNSRATRGLFVLSHAWVNSKAKFDVAICDEAHRLREKTTLARFGVSSNRRQAEEIMENVRIFVAFLDEQQRLRKAEAGTVEYFKQCAIATGIRPENIHGPINLSAQFRCAGNDKFVSALNNVLYTNKSTTFAHQKFEFGIVDTIQELEQTLYDRIMMGRTARIVAGFCWPWSDPLSDNTLVEDVNIGEWRHPWNRKSSGREPPSQHPYTLWATRASNPLTEIGCIYSVQGFEFDYVGVIWGDDLVWRAGHWEPHCECSYDKEMRNGRGVTRPDIALPLLKNAYRVLASRGINGCFIFCKDVATRQHLREVLLGAPLTI